ncbi:MAG: Gfo/Idh/MocA family oxidoreductase [Deltaproteobacteria bacterium]|nr:Gfo/Idh/MocA family oxidoreductase [Deltaproteobacteria bacterium]
MQVLIYGAGSIGNHLAFACRERDWEVTVVDVDSAALERMRSEIYPKRYGAWDPAIRLQLGEEAAGADLVIVGTPPDSHLELAERALRLRPRIVLIEKPLSVPFSDFSVVERLARETGTRVLVGYNHLLCRNTRHVEQLLAEGAIGAPITIRVSWVESWVGILRAHPWLAGPEASYLGNWERGGGSLCEHSHGLNLFQHFARTLGFGEVELVSASFDFVEQPGSSYDRIAQLHLRTEGGLTGLVTQDVVQDPPEKRLTIVGADGVLSWYGARPDSTDGVVLESRGRREERTFVRSRPDDFRGEISHVADVLADRELESPLSLEHGIRTMKVIDGAFRSARERRSEGLR